MGLSEVFVLDASDETLLAHGTSRLSILPALSDLPEPPAELPVFDPPAFDTPDPYLRGARRRPQPERLQRLGPSGRDVGRLSQRDER